MKKALCFLMLLFVTSSVFGNRINLFFNKKNGESSVILKTTLEEMAEKSAYLKQLMFEENGTYCLDGFTKDGFNRLKQNFIRLKQQLCPVEENATYDNYYNPSIDILIDTLRQAEVLDIPSLIEVYVSLVAKAFVQDNFKSCKSPAIYRDLGDVSDDSKEAIKEALLKTDQLQYACKLLKIDTSVSYSLEHILFIGLIAFDTHVSLVIKYTHVIYDLYKSFSPETQALIASMEGIRVIEPTKQPVKSPSSWLGWMYMGALKTICSCF